MSNTIAVIANTDYHFEITLSAYQALIDSGYNPIIYSCHGKKPTFAKQTQFLNLYNLQHTEDIDLIPSDTLGGLVISAYPKRIPNDTNIIFDKLKNRLIYICHRFNTIPTYIDKRKTICLSPLSQHIGLPYFIPNKYPIEILSYQSDSKIKLLIQAHFEKENRDMGLLDRVIDIITRMSNIELHIIGTGIPISLQKKQIPNIIIHSKITEEALYSIINDMSYILPLIENNTSTGTYLQERFSSSFCHSLCMSKPIISHKVFKKIYNIPGKYYSSTTELYNIIVGLDSTTLKDEQPTTLDFNLLRFNSIQHNKLLLNSLFDNLK
jgi:hypothetical protein